MAPITVLTEKFAQALNTAYSLHHNQYRKDQKTPYLAHLLAVTALVLEDGGSETEAIAALLHDAVEDQGGLATRQIIQEQFGEAVINIIDSCTESETIPKPPWQERKQRYLQQIQQASLSAQRVSLADKLHNATDLLRALETEGDIVWQRFTEGKTGILWFYQALLEVYQSETKQSYLFRQVDKMVNQLATISSIANIEDNLAN